MLENCKPDELIFNLDDAKKFRTQVQDAISRRQKSVFSDRTDEASAEQYFQVSGIKMYFYGVHFVNKRNKIIMLLLYF